MTEKRKRKSAALLIAEHFGTDLGSVKDNEYQPGCFSKPVYSMSGKLWSAGDAKPKELGELRDYRWVKIPSSYDPRYTIWHTQDLET